MARKYGTVLLVFDLHGLRWEVRQLKAKHKELDGGDTLGVCHFEDRLIYVSESLSSEQLRMTVAHEIQHAIEEFADVDHTLSALDEGVADRMTDQLARSWVLLIRTNPELVRFFCATD